MSGEDVGQAVFLVMALAVWLGALRGERDWARFWRRRNQDIAQKKADAERAARRKAGAGPWEV